ERYSPAFLVYGQELRHPAQVIDNKILWADKEDSVGEMLRTLKGAMDTLRKTRDKLRVKLEESYNKNRKNVELKIGDKVYAYENSLGKIKSKFAPRWTGPWIIKTVKSNGRAYDITMDGQERSANIDSLIREEREFIEEDMKRPSIGEKFEEDMNEEFEISSEKPQDKEISMDYKHINPVDGKKQEKEER